MVSGLHSASSWAKISLFSSSFSVAASITKSACLLASSRLLVKEIFAWAFLVSFLLRNSHRYYLLHKTTLFNGPLSLLLAEIGEFILILPGDLPFFRHILRSNPHGRITYLLGCQWPRQNPVGRHPLIWFHRLLQ